MAINGDAIYGTHHSILEKQDWGYSTQKGDDIYLAVFNKPMNDLLRLKIPVSNSKDSLYVIDKAHFLSNGKPALLKGEGKPASYYRDKTGISYFDIIIPREIADSKQPFVIRIRLKTIHKREVNDYQQAII
jgi:alpha-L-fucosidase